ncbi:MAG: dihydrolipoamide acetyltransferase family protein [Acidobacteriota bacterium]
MSFEFKLPDIGEGVVEGEIVEWFVSAGDTVAEDQPIVAVMTDKATVEIPSPKAGTITTLGGNSGEILKVGAMLVTIDTDGAGAAPAASAPAAAPTPAPAPKPAPAPAAAAPAPAPTPAPAPVASPAPMAVAASAAPASTGPVNASPATRKRARELGVDLSTVAGTGPNGRVQVSDVELAAARPAAAPAPMAAPAAAAAPALAAVPSPEPLLPIPSRDFGAASNEEERVPLRGLRKVISERMVESKQTAAHFAYVDECEVTELIALRKSLKGDAARYGVKLTYLPFIMKALVPALKQFPLLNSALDPERGELVYKKYYNIGVAVDTEQGLTVPVVKNVDRKSILEIAHELQDLVGRARSQRASMEDLTGGTFTVTSTGNIGGLFATPIINIPEVAILGVPKMQERPVVRDGEIVIRDMLNLALSLDHRVVDGAVGARFMNALIEQLERPSRMLLELA